MQHSHLELISQRIILYFFLFMENHKHVVFRPHYFEGSMLYLLKLALIGCIGLLANTVLAAESGPINYDFCTIDDVAPTADAQQIWGAASVQHYGRRLLANPAVIDSPRAAYPLAYVALTHERDVQRCGGTLGSNDRSDRLIGDLLADVMSRWLMLSVATCAGPVHVLDDSGLCAAVQRQKLASADSLKATVDMTAVYLTSHMGMALVAVAFDDAFWNQEYDVSTHCEPYARCGRDVLEARLVVIRRYKELYDKNNAFLATNLPTVIDTLRSACYLAGNAIPAGARLAALFPTGEVFGNIRDQTFAAALTTARTIIPAEHPMITREGGLNVVQYGSFRAFKVNPQALRAAEANARGILAGDALTWLFKPFGSLSGRALEANKPSLSGSCDYPQLAN